MEVGKSREDKKRIIDSGGNKPYSSPCEVQSNHLKMLHCVWEGCTVRSTMPNCTTKLVIWGFKPSNSSMILKKTWSKSHHSTILRGCNPDRFTCHVFGASTSGRVQREWSASCCQAKACSPVSASAEVNPLSIYIAMYICVYIYIHIYI